ncbi:SIR2 family protein [Bacteroidota bacterium]
MSLKYLSYPAVRDVVFILGAGASYPDGVPLQNHMLPLILHDLPQIQESEIGKPVVDFIKKNFEFDERRNIYPKLEAVFGYLDYFIKQNESLDKYYDLNKLRFIRESLIKIIHYTVNLETGKKSKYYHLFWKAIEKYNSNISIITLNYDTLLEQAFDFLFEKFGYLDYCIDLMNYDKRNQFKQFNYWINPREPVKVKTNKTPVPIKIIKLHGSLNWKYCNCCCQTLLTTWDREIDLKGGKLLGYTFPEMDKYEYVCPIDGTDFETVIIPPSYLKDINKPTKTQLFSEAARELNRAKKIVFIGYSLPETDIHIRALLKKNLSDKTQIIVINPQKTETQKFNYYSILKTAKIYHISFEEFLDNNQLLKSILN